MGLLSAHSVTDSFQMTFYCMWKRSAYTTSQSFKPSYKAHAGELCRKLQEDSSVKSTRYILYLALQHWLHFRTKRVDFADLWAAFPRIEI